MNDTTYLMEIISALKQLNGAGSLKEIYAIIEQNGKLPYVKTNPNWKDNVCAELQKHCKSTGSYRGAPDIFFSVYGLGEGYWGLNTEKAKIISSDLNPIEQRQIAIVENDSNLTDTQKESVILARRGQGYFRKKLIEKYKVCIISKIEDKRLLTASHIKPWRSAADNERLSVNNGLLLSSLYDKMFDSGLITFNIDGYIKISSKLSINDKNIINIDETRKYLVDIPNEMKQNIEYHTRNIFIK